MSTPTEEPTMSDLPPFDPPLVPVPMRADPESYRSPDDPAWPALGGRVLFGGPFAERVDADFQLADAPVRPFLAGNPGFTYTLIRSTVSFMSGPSDPPFVEASLHFILESTPPGDATAPVAWSMAPARVTNPRKVTSRRRLGPQLKILAVEATLGDREEIEEREVPTPSLTTAGLWTATASWTLHRTADRPLDGQQPELGMVVKHPAGAATDLTVVVYTSVRGTGLRRYSTRDLTPGFLRIRLP
ncbi:hypothetical protein ACFO1B_40145 [Dactylosporangium siamense]|uniref:Uncharacterized protein n=1 Tax=Dactylosporangium siamense TaxID=685454 RepID=A0A919UFC3_9ACTN|nr:hypothetical protein [Dactylosporangium siamense]GIG50006.1 hypothetical protein Dsi01nite_080470 [Dactylosporangium siamense]